MQTLRKTEQMETRIKHGISTKKQRIVDNTGSNYGEECINSYEQSKQEANG